jgi:hypothetical protein
MQDQGWRCSKFTPIRGRKKKKKNAINDLPSAETEKRILFVGASDGDEVREHR